MVRRTPRHTRPDTLFPFTTHCRSPRLPLSALFRVSPVGVAGCMTGGIANGAFWALGPAFVLQSGLHVSDVALFMSATVVGGAVSQWPFGRLSDRIDRRLMLMISCIAASASGVAIVLEIGRAHV